MEVLDKENEFAATGTTKCKLCLVEPSRYTCPRCNVPYCSVNCYRCEAHAGCSEGFYKDCFMEGLKDMDSPGDKQEVLDMLKRVHDSDAQNLDSDDEDDDGDVSSIWSRLSEREKAEFNRMTEDGRIGELVEVWSPWWTARTKQKKSLVEDLSASSENMSAAVEIPPAIQNIPPMNDKKPLSNQITYNIINIIYGYAYITRLYNGDYMDVATQSSQELLLLSPALGPVSYESTSGAVQACLQSLANQARSLYVSRSYSVGVLYDVQQIVQGSGDEPVSYTVAVLSDIHRLCQRALTEMKKTKSKAKKSVSSDPAKVSNGCQPKSMTAESAESSTLAPPKPPSTDCYKSIRSQLYAVCKKCEFLVSWVRQYSGSLRDATLPEVAVLICDMSSRLADERKIHKNLDKIRPSRKGRHKLIEEV